MRKYFEDPNNTFDGLLHQFTTSKQYNSLPNKLKKDLDGCMKKRCNDVIDIITTKFYNTYNKCMLNKYFKIELYLLL